MEHPAEQTYSVRASAGNLPIECFLAAHTFFAADSAGQPAFSEDHVHACFELIFCKRGAGFQFIGGVGHPYASNSIFLITPFTTHAHISNAQAPEIRYSVRFILPEGQELSSSCDPAVEYALKKLRQNGYFHFMAENAPLPIIDMIADTVRTHPVCAELVLGGLLSALFSYVFQEICLAFGEGASPGRQLLAENANTRKFLIDNFFDQLIDSNARMEELCSRVHLSPSQLNRVIRELYGTTFKQRMIEVRLAYIKYFLKYSDLPVREIAQRTGFPEDSNLSLFFKQHCGVSPTQYRQAERVVPPSAHTQD